MRGHSSLWLALAIGATMAPGVARASPLLSGYYGTSTATSPADGLCQLGTPNCAPGRSPIGSVVTGESYGEYSIQLPAPSSTGLGSNFTYAITVADVSATSGIEYYGVYVDGNSIGSTLATAKTTTFDVTLAVLPASTFYYLDLTNEYFLAQGSNYSDTSSSQVEVSVSQIAVPEPGALALLTTSLGLIGLVRRRAKTRVLDLTCA